MSRKSSKPLAAPLPRKAKPIVCTHFKSVNDPHKVCRACRDCSPTSRPCDICLTISPSQLEALKQSREQSERRMIQNRKRSAMLRSLPASAAASSGSRVSRPTRLSPATTEHEPIPTTTSVSLPLSSPSSSASFQELVQKAISASLPGIVAAVRSSIGMSDNQLENNHVSSDHRGDSPKRLSPPPSTSGRTLRSGAKRKQHTPQNSPSKRPKLPLKENGQADSPPKPEGSVKKEDCSSRRASVERSPLPRHPSPVGLHVAYRTPNADSVTHHSSEGEVGEPKVAVPQENNTETTDSANPVPITDHNYNRKCKDNKDLAQAEAPSPKPSHRSFYTILPTDGDQSGQEKATEAGDTTKSTSTARHKKNRERVASNASLYSTRPLHFTLRPEPFNNGWKWLEPVKEAGLTMDVVVPLVYEALPENVCQRPPDQGVLDQTNPDQPQSSVTRLPQSNQLFKELLRCSTALSMMNRTLESDKPSTKVYFGIRGHSSQAFQHLQPYPESERLPGDCPMDSESKMKPPEAISIGLGQYEMEERVTRAALRANSHADLMYSAAYAYIEKSGNTIDEAEAAQCRDKALLLMRKAYILHGEAVHLTTQTLVNSMLHRRDAYLSSAVLSSSQRNTLRCLPIHNARTLFNGQLKALAPAMLEQGPVKLPIRMQHTTPPMPVSSAQAASMQSPSIPSPSMQGTLMPAPLTNGLSTQVPLMQTPSIQAPTIQRPSMQRQVRNPFTFGAINPASPAPRSAAGIALLSSVALHDAMQMLSRTSQKDGATAENNFGNHSVPKITENYEVKTSCAPMGGDQHVYRCPSGRASGWTAQQVGQWLLSLGMKKHKKAFVENNISGPELLKLHSDRMKELGVSSGSDRSLLKRKLRRLKNGKHTSSSKRLAEKLRKKAMKSGKKNFNVS